jgi:uncharacterized protein YndB with AHSA1/START domain
MTTVTVSSQIAAPVERVFQLFTDVEHGPAHVSGIKKIEMLTPGHFKLGTRWRETRDIVGTSDSAFQLSIVGGATCKFLPLIVTVSNISGLHL